MTKYIIGEFLSSGRATLYKNPSDQTVSYLSLSNCMHVLMDSSFFFFAWNLLQFLFNEILLSSAVNKKWQFTYMYKVCPLQFPDISRFREEIKKSSGNMYTTYYLPRKNYCLRYFQRFRIGVSSKELFENP